ncbi:MAG: VanZ family protein [Roseburia sp.]
MDSLLSSISLGAAHFPMTATILALPILLFEFIRSKKINLFRIGLCFLFLFYMLCAYALIIFPLPDVATAATLSGHQIQWIPFHFVADIIRETPFVVTDVHTYLPALLDNAVLQVAFNVLLTVPFGMFIGYYFNLSQKKVILFSFLLSLFFELTQLTGLYFIYPGSYRLCDVDDLIANTFGGFLGYRLMLLFEKYLRKLDHAI